MKVPLTLLVSLSLFFAVPLQAQTGSESGGDCLQSKLRGEMAGEESEDSTENFLWGCGAGGCCGFLGCLGIGLYAYTKDTPQILNIPEGEDGACYLQGYEEGAKKKRLKQTLIGGAIGAVVATALTFTINFLNAYYTANGTTSRRIMD